MYSVPSTSQTFEPLPRSQVHGVGVAGLEVRRHAVRQALQGPLVQRLRLGGPVEQDACVSFSAISAARAFRRSTSTRTTSVGRPIYPGGPGASKRRRAVVARGSRGGSSRTGGRRRSRAPCTARITAWRSSLFLPVTRTWSPWIWLWTLTVRALDELHELLGLLLGDPDVHVDGLPVGALRGRLDRARRGGPSGEISRFTAFSLQDLERGLQPVLGRGAELDQLVVLADRGAGVLEVEPLGDLAAAPGRRRSRPRASRPGRRCRTRSRPWPWPASYRELDGAAVAILQRTTGGCPSGQRERSVKSPAKPTEVRILLLPPHHVGIVSITEAPDIAELTPTAFRR